MKSISSRIAAIVLLGCVGLAIDASAAAIRTDTGFTTTALPKNDDGSTGAVTIGFNINFFGITYNRLFVNNNGNVTFDGPFGAFTLIDFKTIETPIIAPFFADVDTRFAGSVSYGNSTIDGRAAFGVNWMDVRSFSLSGVTSVNSFQMVMIDRSDTGVGNFDLEFNYGKIGWDTGDGSGGNSAKIGWSNGSTSSFELPGSGVNGAFLDGGSNSLLIGAPVRFAVRNGPPTSPVPDGGSTALLLGVALLGFEGARRRLAKS